MIGFSLRRFTPTVVLNGRSMYRSITPGSKNWKETDVSRALRAEELAAWKRLIRVIGHELNNSLAPITSLAGSLERLVDQHQSGEREHSAVLWSLLMFESFLRQVHDGAPPAAATGAKRELADADAL